MKALSLSEVDAIITANKVPRDKYPVVVVAVRGWKFSENRRRHYDDLHVIRTPEDCHQFPGNCDPNGFRDGEGTGAKKGMAVLATGIHFFVPGYHKSIPNCFRQGEEFTVIRDGKPPLRDLGMHAIDWHPGGGDVESVGVTGSAGCQTNPKGIFATISKLIREACAKFKQKMGKNDRNQTGPEIPYILIEEAKRKRGQLVVSKRFF